MSVSLILFFFYRRFKMNKIVCKLFCCVFCWNVDVIWDEFCIFLVKF